MRIELFVAFIFYMFFIPQNINNNRSSIIFLFVLIANIIAVYVFFYVCCRVFYFIKLFKFFFPQLFYFYA